MTRTTGTNSITSSRQPPPTTCKVCWTSIYGNDRTAWVTTPHPGLAHADCAAAANKTDTS